MFPPFVKLGLEIDKDMDASASMTNKGKALCKSVAYRIETTGEESATVATANTARRRILQRKMEDVRRSSCFYNFQLVEIVKFTVILASVSTVSAP